MTVLGASWVGEPAFGSQHSGGGIFSTSSDIGVLENDLSVANACAFGSVFSPFIFTSILRFAVISLAVV